MRLIPRRRRRATNDRDDAVTALRQLEREHDRDQARTDHPNFGYQTPFDGGQFPGTTL